MTDSIQPGIYKHYKEQLYRVYGTCRHSETEELLVVYRCLYGDHSLWVRPYTMFCENVIIDGVEKKRFELIQAESSTTQEQDINRH